MSVGVFFSCGMVGSSTRGRGLLSNYYVGMLLSNGGLSLVAAGFSSLLVVLASSFIMIRVGVPL